ncbi:MAG: twin-arginine translocase TatA/TatE family subunit [Hyphomicrobiales bacterium]
MAPSWFQILIVVVLLVLLFGRGKISELMGDVAKGIKSFKKGMSDDAEEAKAEAKTIEHSKAESVGTPKNKAKAS